MNQTQFGPIRFIPGKNEGKYPYCHSLLIEGETKVLVDPASDREVLAALREDPGVDQVWLSHYHEDHFMHLDLFDDLPLFIHEADAPALTDLDAFIDFYGPIEKFRKEWETFITDTFHFRPREASALEPGVVDLGGVTVEIIHAPGHTQGHCCLWFPDQEVLFLADYDLTPFGPFYGDLDADIEDIIRSVNRLRQYPAKVWLTCHETGVFTEEPGAAWDRFLNVIEKRESRLLEVMKEPATMDDLIDARIVYRKGREPKMFYDFGEMGIARAHLKRLMNQGRVEKNGDCYRLLD